MEDYLAWTCTSPIYRKTKKSSGGLDTPEANSSEAILIHLAIQAPRSHFIVRRWGGGLKALDSSGACIKDMWAVIFPPLCAKRFGVRRQGVFDATPLSNPLNGCAATKAVSPLPTAKPVGIVATALQMVSHSPPPISPQLGFRGWRAPPTAGSPLHKSVPEAGVSASDPPMEENPHDLTIEGVFCRRQTRLRREVPCVCHSATRAKLFSQSIL